MNPSLRLATGETGGYNQFERDGFQIIRAFCEAEECDVLSRELTILFESQQNNVNKRIGGVRNLLRSNDRVVEFAASPKMKNLLGAVLGDCRPVRAIFFDKIPNANWSVPWHQDLAIAVAARLETPGYTGWSIKDGVHHVNPPVGILEKMITVRLHLDNCDAKNGALKVIPNSHQSGRLDAPQISDWVNRSVPYMCEACRGDVLLMRPLLLHASSPSVFPIHRRVLHIEYAAASLPGGLQFFEQNEP